MREAVIEPIGISNDDLIIIPINNNEKHSSRSNVAVGSHW